MSRQSTPLQASAAALSARVRLFLLSVVLCPLGVFAGPFAPAAGLPGSTAIEASDRRIVGWATDVVAYEPGPEVAAEWTNPNRALGPSTADNFDIVSLGRGSITLTFDQVVEDRPGPDFAVFENGFSLAPNSAFLELAFVEVSSDGTNFVRFPATSLSPEPDLTETNFLLLDATNLDGLAGKYTLGFGTPFDLSDLPVKPIDTASTPTAPTTFNSNAVTHLRLVDIVGDGTTLDHVGNPIYDQTPTVGSVGFDLEAIAVLQAPMVEPPPTNDPPFVLEITLRDGERGFVLETTTQPGSNYVVQSKDSLDAPEWREVFAFEASGDMRQFSIDTPVPLQFWRIHSDPRRTFDPDTPSRP